MSMLPYAWIALKNYRVKYNVLDEIRREDSKMAQARKNARKQRARELTKARELEIKKAKGETDGSK